jgi:Pentapeptide repeats (8 copies)
LRRSGLNWAILALLIVAFGAFLWIAPERQVSQKEVPGEKRLSEEKRLALVNEYRRTWAQILGGAALLGGLYFTWRTLRVNREGQITERFTRAIDHLGKVENGQKLFEIRMGGIYALERIARESQEDYWPIMEILSAYVRQNAPRWPGDDQGGTDDATEGQSALEGSKGKSETTEPADLDPDIQAIITVLRRRTRYYGHGEPESLNLSRTNLSRANFRGANLSEARFRGADLSSARLERANLSGARLTREAKLEANLTRAHLEGANLSGARLEGTKLTQKQLDETKLGDNETQLPPDLKPPAHWNVRTDEQIEEG